MLVLPAGPAFDVDGEQAGEHLLVTVALDVEPHFHVLNRHHDRLYRTVTWSMPWWAISSASMAIAPCIALISGPVHLAARPARKVHEIAGRSAGSSSQTAPSRRAPSDCASPA